MVDRACRLAFREGFAKAGQRIIIVAGVPLGTPGATNMVRIAFVGIARRGGQDLDIPSLDLLGQGLHEVGTFGRCGFTASARRKASSASLSSPNSCMMTPRPDERAEVPRLARQHLAEVGERLAEVLVGEIERGAPVPGFDIVGLEPDHGSRAARSRACCPCPRSRSSPGSSADRRCRCPRRARAPRCGLRRAWRCRRRARPSEPRTGSRDSWCDRPAPRAATCRELPGWPPGSAHDGPQASDGGSEGRGNRQDFELRQHATSSKASTLRRNRRAKAHGQSTVRNAGTSRRFSPGGP